jgi:mannose-6-phosphate isomerase-like protein (cupin superfamily)
MRLAFALLLALTLSAQTPRRRQFIVGDNPADALKIDNSQVRVIIDTELPFETEAPRQHPRDRVLVYLDGGHFTMTNSDGRVEDVNVKAGDLRYSRAGTPYIIENLSGHPLRIVEIELKTGPNGSGPAPATKLDPTIVDPAHYTLESENPQIRVLKIHFGPHEKSVLHEHQMNRVVIYLNDQGQFKEGDVRMAGASTHTEENAGDTPADRIAIEIK